MPDSKAFIEIKVDGDTIIIADTEYIADYCFFNGIVSWTENLKVNGNIELIITPCIGRLKMWERIKLWGWDLLCVIEERFKKRPGADL